MKPTKWEKRKAYWEWWLNIFPIGFAALITPWVMYPLAELIELVLPKNNPLWWWLDDEIENEETNADWREYKTHLPYWLRLYRWHCERNSMWNWKASRKPESASKHGEYNYEVVLQIIWDDMVRNGEKLIIGSVWIEMPVVRWIDENGNATWQTLSGIEVNIEKSVFGKLYIWYMAHGKLYFRKGYVKEVYQWGFKKKFPFIGKFDYFIVHASGCNEKRFIFTHKRQLIPKNYK